MNGGLGCMLDERTGLSRYCNKPECDVFGEKTNFRLVVTNIVKGVVNNHNKWFSFCNRVDDSQVDVMSIQGNEKNPKLGTIISRVYEECAYKVSIYKYLITEFLCYYEVPSVVKSSEGVNGFKSGYSKCLITANVGVIANWLGVSYEEAKAQYGARVDGANPKYDDGSNMIPYVKLYETKDGVRKITKPRSDLDLSTSGTRVVPVFALQVGVDALYNKLKECTYDVTFVKDSGQKRLINTTFNEDYIRSIYEEGGYVDKAVESWYNGEFLKNSALERGYIRVFEVGASIYDSPLRSVNYARIVSFEKAEPDLAYINIDLDSVLSSFKDGIYSVKGLSVSEVVESLKLFEVGSGYTINGVKLLSVNDLEVWADAQHMLLSTVFLRQLALFMMGNPQWFGGYTGAPKVITSSNDGAGMEAGADFDFELG